MSSNSIIFTAVIAALSSIGCVGTLTERVPSADAGPFGAADAQIQTAARITFDQNIAPILTTPRPKGACIICHQGPEACPNGGGSCYLGEDGLNHYGSLTVAQAVGNGMLLITATPATSRFLQRGDHNGNAFCTGPGVPYANCTQNEVQLIENWINLEGGL